MRFPNRGKIVNGRKKTYKKSSPKRTLTKTIKKEIKKIEIRNAEHKCQSYSVTAQPIQVFNGLLNTLTTIDCTNVLYNIISGTQDGARIGNKIRLSSLRVSGSLNIVLAAAITNVYIRVVLLRKKVGVDTPNGTYNNLFQLGGSSVAPTGTTQDLMRNLNRDFYTVYGSKHFLLGSSDAVTSTLAGNDTAISRMFNFSVKGIKNIIYNDTTTFPMNCSFYLAFVPCLANGFAISTAQVAPFYVSVDVEARYTDL